MLNPDLHQLIERLLNSTTITAQIAILRAVDLLNARGMTLLLDEVEELADVEPAKARQLSLICEEAAETADAPAAVPRSHYLRARTHAIHGEFELALDLIQSASSTYTALQMHTEALRTQVGLMNVLDELGRYPEALEAGQNALHEIARFTVGSTAPLAPDLQRIEARIHVNRGVSYMQLGRYQESLDAYAVAEIIFQSLDDSEWLANVHSNYGLILTYLGRVRDALGAFERAEQLRAEMPPDLAHAHTLLNIGEAQGMLGNYAQSLATFQQAQRLLVELDARVDQQINQIHIAGVYLTLNLYPEALTAYGAAEQLLRELEMVYELALALWGMGAARIAQRNFAQADLLLAEAETLFQKINNAPLHASVLLERAALQLSQGQREAALALAMQALALVSPDRESDTDAGTIWPVQQVYAYLRIADLLLPDTAAAEPHLVAAERLLAKLTLPHLRYRLLQRFGHLRRIQGSDGEAQSYLTLAVAEIEQLRNTLTHEAMRTSFLYDKLVAYEELMRLHLDTDVRQAFGVSERARARALVELLTGVVEPPKAIPTDPNLSTQIIALQADLNALYNQLLDGSGQNEHGVSAEHLRARLTETEERLSWLRLQSASASQQSPVVFDPLTISLSLDEIQAHIPADLILISYYVLGEEIIVFVIGQERFHLIRNISTAPAVQPLLQRLNLQWDRFRADPAFVARHLHQFEQSTQRLLTALYDLLIAPIESYLAAPPSLGEITERKAVIVPHGLLHQVPFQALHNDEQYLLERFTISYAPSATAWALCQQRNTRQEGNALVLGVADASLPAVESEVKAVAQQLQEAEYQVDLRLNENVTLTTLPDNVATCRLLHVATCRLLHVACHGLFRADNPMFSALKLHDGWLTASDLMQLDLSGILVTLSACESGRSRVVVGDEIIGLIRALLGADASTVVVSQWLVQDEATALLMATWYEALKQSDDKAAALRQAQLATKTRYPHPYYWAPFILVGQR